MNKKTTNIANRYQSFIVKVFVIAIITFAWALATPTQTMALVDNYPGVPNYLRSLTFYGSPQSGPCDRDHAQATWISLDRDFTSVDTFALALGQNSIGLRANTMAAVCDKNTNSDGSVKNKNLEETHSIYAGNTTISVDNPAISIGGIDLTQNTDVGVSYYCVNKSNLRFAKACDGNDTGNINYGPNGFNFTLSGFSSLTPGTHNIYITTRSFVYNIFSGPYYVCVNTTGPDQPIPTLRWFDCQQQVRTFLITVTVPQPTYIGQIQTVKIDKTTGALAADAQMLNAKTQIYQAGGAVISPCGALPTCSNIGSNNWLTGVVMWVNPSKVDSNDNTTGYLSKIDVPDKYKVSSVKLIRNGTQTDVTPTTTGGLSCTGGLSNNGTCSITTKVWNQDTTWVYWYLEKIPQPIEYYPWLQTKNGDVTSANNSTDNGKITGQKIGSATDSNFRRGARRAGTGTIAATVAESSFVVTATDAGDYFCAQERFVLGKSLADRDNLDDGSCKTGGYTPSPVNFDKVKASVSKAYADNGNGVPVAATQPNKCNPKYATTAVATAASLSTTFGLGCPTGGIQKIGVQADTVTLSSALTVNGRGTLWIPGKLIINNDIKYGTSTTNDPKTTPNLVIFVEGDVEIAPNVLQIDASIISMKTISTCSQSTVSTRACENKLVINGFLAGGGKINFARRYYAEPYATATPSPAELINLTSQSTTFPAPGLDRTDTDVTSKLQINSGELAPRLR